MAAGDEDEDDDEGGVIVTSAAPKIKVPKAGSKIITIDIKKVQFFFKKKKKKEKKEKKILATNAQVARITPPFVAFPPFF